MTSVAFYFDPACPWTWATSRWLVDVAPRRDLDVRWLTFSLRHGNRDREIPEQYRAPMDAQFRGLRVIEAARDRHGDEVVGRLYTALGARIHHDGDVMLEDLAGAVAEAGVDESALSAAEDPSWDAVIEASTDKATGLVGEDVGIPIIVIDGAPATFSGPIVSPAPTGDDALALWDAFASLSRLDGVYEIKRSRTGGPQLPARPAV